MIAALNRVLDHPMTDRVILGLIIFNALTLGLETSPTVMARWGDLLNALDRALLAVFVAELLARLVVKRLAFFRDGWNVFDFIVIGIALLPSTGDLSVLRSLRVLRVLRLVTVVPSLKRVVGALLGSLPGMGSIAFLLLLIFYVFGVMATKLFGETHPQLFGTLGDSLLTLFQVMTLDAWSDGVMRPISEKHPYAWMFFLPFVLATAFTALNLFIGVVVGALEAEGSAEAKGGAVAAMPGEVLAEVRALRAEIAALRTGGMTEKA